MVQGQTMSHELAERKLETLLPQEDFHGNQTTVSSTQENVRLQASGFASWVLGLKKPQVWSQERNYGEIGPGTAALA